MASKDSGESEKSACIVPHWKSKGIDICGDSATNIIRSDLGCFLRVTNDLHKEQTGTISPLHKMCAYGDHYFSLYNSPVHDSKLHFIMKGNSCRRVEDLSTSAGAVVFDVHKDCQGGDFYLATSKFHTWSTSHIFIIVNAKNWTFKVVSDLNTAKPSSYYKEMYPHAAKHDGSYNLHDKCKGGLYYWTTKGYYGGMWFYIIKHVSEWGVVVHYTEDLYTDKGGKDETIDHSVSNFLPGGLAVSMGTPVGHWALIKSISNEHKEIPMDWSSEVLKRVGHKKKLSKAMKMNWNMTTTLSEEATAEITVELVAKAQCKSELSVSHSIGGEIGITSDEEWGEEKEVKENELSITNMPILSL